MKKKTRRHSLLLLLFLPSLAFSQTKTGADIYQAQCSSCHGQEGLGSKALSAPRLAGQLGGYVEEQLINFKTGRRGGNPSDINGSLMRASVNNLSKEEIQLVSRYLEQSSVEKTTVKEDTAQEKSSGKSIYDSTCGDCHGAKAQGSANLVSANLSILSSWYLRNQFEAYSRGWRGDSKSGTTRSIGMRAILQQLDDKEQQAVIDYLSK